MSHPPRLTLPGQLIDNVGNERNVPEHTVLTPHPLFGELGSPAVRSSSVLHRQYRTDRQWTTLTLKGSASSQYHSPPRALSYVNVSPFSMVMSEPMPPVVGVALGAAVLEEVRVTAIVEPAASVVVSTIAALEEFPALEDDLFRVKPTPRPTPRPMARTARRPRRIQSHLRDFLGALEPSLAHRGFSETSAGSLALYSLASLDPPGV